MSNTVVLIWSLREQAAYLRSPMRRCGPSASEAEDAACSLERESDSLSEYLFDQIENSKAINV